MFSNVNRKSVSHHFASFALVCVGALSSCHGVDYGSGSSSLAEAGCDETYKSFDSSKNEQPKMSVAALPPGQYLPVNSEAMFIDATSTSKTYPQGSRFHFLQVPASETDYTNTSVVKRCSETDSFFLGYSDQVTVPDSFIRYKDLSFTTKDRFFNFTFSQGGSARVTNSYAGGQASVNAPELAYALSGFWTSGYWFSRISGDTFAFYGTRDVGNGRIIKAKATFRRVALPANSH